MPSTVTFVRDLFDGARGAYRHLGEVLAPDGTGGFKLRPATDVRERPARIGRRALKRPRWCCVQQRAPAGSGAVGQDERPPQWPIASRRAINGPLPCLALPHRSTRADPAAADADCAAGRAWPCPEDACGPRPATGSCRRRDWYIRRHTPRQQLVLTHLAVTLAAKTRGLAAIRRH